MSQGDRDVADRVRSALGSSRVIELPGLPSGGPIDLLHLRSRVAELREEPQAVECRMRVSAESWRELEALAAELATDGQEVTPTQLAGLLLERGVAALRDSRRKSG